MYGRVNDAAHIGSVVRDFRYGRHGLFLSCRSSAVAKYPRFCRTCGLPHSRWSIVSCKREGCRVHRYGDHDAGKYHTHESDYDCKNPGSFVPRTYVAIADRGRGDEGPVKAIKYRPTPLPARTPSHNPERRGKPKASTRATDPRNSLENVIVMPVYNTTTSLGSQSLHLENPGCIRSSVRIVDCQMAQVK